MMKAGLEGLSGGEHLPILIAVTQLTSTDQRMMEEELFDSENREGSGDSITGKMPRRQGFTAWFAPPHEAKEIHERIGSDS